MYVRRFGLTFALIRRQRDGEAAQVILELGELRRADDGTDSGRLLCGRQGDMLRQLARPSSQLAHVNRAIAIICSRYDVEATLVSVDVGYESTSQFNREYRRLFGKPPGPDAAEARRAFEANVAAAYGRAY